AGAAGWGAVGRGLEADALRVGPGAAGPGDARIPAPGSRGVEGGPDAGLFRSGGVDGGGALDQEVQTLLGRPSQFAVRDTLDALRGDGDGMQGGAGPRPLGPDADPERPRADPEQVAGLQGRGGVGLQSDAVDERPVPAAQLGHEPGAVAGGDGGAATRDGLVEEADVAVGGTSDRRVAGGGDRGRGEGRAAHWLQPQHPRWVQFRRRRAQPPPKGPSYSPAR